MYLENAKILYELTPEQQTDLKKHHESILALLEDRLAPLLQKETKDGVHYIAPDEGWTREDLEIEIRKQKKKLERITAGIHPSWPEGDGMEEVSSLSGSSRERLITLSGNVRKLVSEDGVPSGLEGYLTIVDTARACRRIDGWTFEQDQEMVQTVTDWFDRLSYKQKKLVEKNKWTVEGGLNNKTQRANAYEEYTAYIRDFDQILDRLSTLQMSYKAQK